MFHIKQNPDDSIARYKTRIFANGFHQQTVIDFHETFNPVINPITVRTLLSIALNNKWGIFQLDVNFLNGHLTEKVYMAQPQGMKKVDYLHHVFCLHKAIYGLKQTLQDWYQVLRTFLLGLAFVTSHADSSLFVYSCSNALIYFLVYVDDLIITSSDPSLVDNIIWQLDSKLSTKDLGVQSFFCGVEVLATSIGLLLSQQKYVIDLLSKHNMLDSKPISTPLVIDTSLIATNGSTPINVTMYHQVVGGLQHFRMTCPDISFVMNKLSQFIHTSFEHHWGVIKCLLRYLKGRRSLGIHHLVNTPLSLHCFSDANWAGNPDDRTSIGV